ncbi:MAG: isopentenyl-diphosphate Delta-isomerase [Candidatus Aenigmarchaeota archaeon]|nr:isopentenyl-diphosphate Delta-isomerase [Candidatus Aenigmarchaeota archaeon]
MVKELIVLVDENDREAGSEEKLKAHQNGGRLHRAFSVFVFNSRGEMLLQQRAMDKYHCAGLWTNTCCSHQHPDETTGQAAHRKLKQEMGFDVPLREIFKFTYRTEFSNGLTEHELDHVFVGRFDGVVKPNPEEAAGFRWVGLDELRKDVKANPEAYTPWFKIVLDRVIDWYNENKRSF